MEITPFNLSLPAETIDSLLLWLDDKQGIIIKQTDLLSGTGQSTTATMTQKAITDALGTKADASSVYTKTQTDTLLNAKADKSTTYTKGETDNLLNDKVDKEPGKGLSSNDYTDAEKTKLGALPTGAELSADLAAKQDKDTDAVAGNVAVMNGNGNSVDGGVALSDLATKAEVEAVQEEVAQIAGEAGLAEAVIDTDGAGTEQEFTFRKSGGDGGAYYRKIKGKTLAWNQMCPLFSEVSGVPRWSIETFTKDVSTDGKTITITFTSATNPRFRLYHGSLPTHTFFVCYDYRINSLASTFSWATSGVLPPLVPGGSQVDVWLHNKKLISYDGSGDSSVTYPDISSSKEGAQVSVRNYRIIDLTLFFNGSIPSGYTAEDFENEYGYLLQDADVMSGTLISNDAEAVETTGVNQWDEEWELGLISTTGTNVSDTNHIRSKNYIKVIPGESYYFTLPTGKFARVIGYDGNKNFIRHFGNGVGQIAIEMPQDVEYLRFCVYSDSYGSTYNHDICINLSNPAINGQYFPYWKRTLQLGLTTREDTDGNVPFADGMKGVGTAADWADKVGGEKRMGRVDLGSLGWMKISGAFYALYTQAKNSSSGDDMPAKVICARYETASANSIYNNLVDRAIGIWSYQGGSIIVRDNSYTDAATFKAAMHGVYLDYELATPVPFTWAEPLNLGVKVDENGTERAVAPEGATEPSAPFVADTTYTMSVARMVEILKNL